MRQFIHKAAIVALLIVALMSIAGTVSSPLKGVSVIEQILHPIIALAVWTFLVWKIWSRPRKWGLGVGIFLLFMIIFQTYLWRLALAETNHDTLGIASTTFGFIIYEIPLAVATFSCFLLRWHFPKEPGRIEET